MVASGLGGRASVRCGGERESEGGWHHINDPTPGGGCAVSAEAKGVNERRLAVVHPGEGAHCRRICSRKILEHLRRS